MLSAYSAHSTLSLCHNYLKQRIITGMVCIDATAGHGRDTVLLASLTGKYGRVFAFDIQPEAIENTRTLLSERGLLEQVRLILDSHEYINDYLMESEKIDAAVFNLGYLPASDRRIVTAAPSTISAIESILPRLSKNGFISVCLYCGKDTGFKERDALLPYLKSLDHRAYTVMLHDFYNRPNNPPQFFVIEKN